MILSADLAKHEMHPARVLQISKILQVLERVPGASEDIFALIFSKIHVHPDALAGTGAMRTPSRASTTTPRSMRRRCMRDDVCECIPPTSLVMLCMSVPSVVHQIRSLHPSTLVSVTVEWSGCQCGSVRRTTSCPIQ